MKKKALIDRTAIIEQLRVIEQNGKLTDAQKFRLAKFTVENAPIAKLDATDTNVGGKGGEHE